MGHAGRKPTGPALAQHLEGSERAKLRLEVILSTIAGQMTVDEACSRLGISPPMFYRLRTEVLEAGLACLEPRPMGRPPHTPTAEELRCAELSQEVRQLRSELKLAEVREEVARVMPCGGEVDPPGKKTTPTGQRSHLRRKRRPSRHKTK